MMKRTLKRHAVFSIALSQAHSLLLLRSPISRDRKFLLFNLEAASDAQLANQYPSPKSVSCSWARELCRLRPMHQAQREIRRTKAWGDQERREPDPTPFAFRDSLQYFSSYSYLVLDYVEILAE